MTWSGTVDRECLKGIDRDIMEVGGGSGVRVDEAERDQFLV